MRKLMMNRGARAAAAVSLALCILLLAGSITGTVYLYGSGAVDKTDQKYYETDIFASNMARDASYYMGYYYYNSESGQKEIDDIVNGMISDGASGSGQASDGNSSGNTGSSGGNASGTTSASASTSGGSAAGAANNSAGNTSANSSGSTSGTANNSNNANSSNSSGNTNNAGSGAATAEAEEADGDIINAPREFIQGQLLTKIPFEMYRHKDYSFEAGGYTYNVGISMAGRHIYRHEDGSVAFVLYSDSDRVEYGTLLYLPGNLYNNGAYSFSLDAREADPDTIYSDGMSAAINMAAAALYLDEGRNVVCASDGEIVTMLESHMYHDDRQVESLPWYVHEFGSYSGSDFRNKNLQIAIYDGSAAVDPADPADQTAASDADNENGGSATDTSASGNNNAAEISAENSDSVEARLKDYALEISNYITVEKVTVTEGPADVSGLGKMVVSENYPYEGDVDCSAIFHYSNGMSVVCSVIDPVRYFDTYMAVKLAHNLSAPFGSMIILADIILAVLCLALFTFLMMAAGRRRLEYAEISERSADDGDSGIGRNPTGGPSADTARDSEMSASGAAQNTTAGQNIEEKYSYWSEKRAERVCRRQEKRRIREQKWNSRGYTIVAGLLDRIPFDLFALLAAALGGGALTVMVVCLDAPFIWNRPSSQAYPLFALTVAAAIVLFAVFILFCMSCAVRWKLGEWWKNTLIWRIGGWLVRGFRSVMRKLMGPASRTVKECITHIGIQWKLAAAFLLILAVNVAAGYNMTFYGNSAIAFLGAVFDIIAFFAVMAVGLMLLKLKKGGKALADGDLEAKVDTSRLVGDFREHGENLNNISKGMSAAIEQKMKSERMKTELITNVSHDIKTPLTSIVNYVDLLSREELDGKAGEYTQVLVRQSARLKKLTEDLVEASKASTGNISVNLQEIDIREAVNQAVAEYEERLAASSLDVVVDFPEGTVLAAADGRLLWRVLDNLLNNACKYSMPGTRVYITVSETVYGNTGSRNHTRREMHEDASDRSGFGGKINIKRVGTMIHLEKTSRKARKNMSGNDGYFDAAGYGWDAESAGQRPGNPGGAAEFDHSFESAGRGPGSAGHMAGFDLRAQGHGNEGGAAGSAPHAQRRRHAGIVTIMIKNISKERLNIAAEELTERFVRGDSSRTTEGSGLGLNIARSLTELQGGKFSISIDGDLFKAQIELNR